jgi:rhodanese-related sulfurtransferase
MMATHSLTDPARAYAGDVSPAEAWAALADDARAQLVDVRTQPEWTFSGLPELSALGKKTLCLSWKFYPTFALNTDFIQQLHALVPDLSTPLYLLCKTGGRSLDAALAATEAGYTTCHNIAGGFEGDRNGEGQRGKINGWKAAQLHWEQA